jgi:Rrf2 family nitric oxide-sensitive transcriptional repressor
MRLNKSTNDALRIAIRCAEADATLVKAGALATDLDLTLPNVLKLIHLLSHAGIVAPVRGRYGGVTLARPAVAISVGDIVRAMEADLEADGTGRPSPTGEVIDDAFEAFLAILDAHSIADMARKTSTAGTKAQRKPAKRSQAALLPLTRAAVRRNAP